MVLSTLKKAACGALFLVATLSLAQSAPPQIIVVGAGVADMEPEIARVRLGIETQKPSAKAAQADASSTAQKIISALFKLGVDSKAIQTDALTLESVFREARDVAEPPKLVAYRASNSVMVRLTDLQKVGPVVDAAIEAGANEVQDITFGALNDVKARQAALKDAVAEARLKAEAIAEALGVTLGDVIEVSEAGYSYDNVRVAALESRSSATPVQPGQITIRASVTIKYLIKRP
jgi:uncharacterized protein YggE